MTKIDIIIEFLKARFEADIEVRESSYLTEHSNHDFVFGGARIFDIEGEEYVVSVNQIRGTGITLLDFDVEGVRYGGKIVKETEAEKIERETASLKAELEASSSSFELDYRNHQFAFGQQIFVSRSVSMPARVGDNIVVVATNRKRFEGKVQRYFLDGDHYLVVVKPEEFRPTYDEYLAAKKQSDDDMKIERDKASKAGLAVAKKLGGKVLTGTKQQKIWANQIRGDAITRMTKEDAKIVLASGQFDDAEFWINSRERLATVDLVKFFNIRRS